MTKSKQLGNPSMPLKEPVLHSEPTGLKPITKLFPSTSLGHITKFGQLGQFSNQNTCLYPRNLTVTDFGHQSKTLTTLRPKPVILSPPLTNLRWKPNGIDVLFFYFFSVRGNVTESTIIATIYYPEVGYCLFGNPLVTLIPDHIPCTFLICYSFLLGSTFLSSLVSTPCSQDQIGILYAS